MIQFNFMEQRESLTRVLRVCCEGGGGGGCVESGGRRDDIEQSEGENEPVCKQQRGKGMGGGGAGGGRKVGRGGCSTLMTECSVKARRSATALEGREVQVALWCRVAWRWVGSLQQHQR